eukprot:TRINITY_DN25942_c0_g1_i1.p1 TRINITY_DN25942_c0_g1~~TRINITY_DN25942_c0_g1_i1.p1  ORF type:complete len:446 (-),score=38.52 TRINITY_DN25942_c0_g1_i1:369-1706(-)
MSVFTPSRDGARMRHSVQLVISELGGIPGATAYHSSVVVDGEEFSFSDGGISRAQGAASHCTASIPPRTLDMGDSSKSGDQLSAALGQHFLPGTYDLLRKNCNTFSDISLYFLTQRRLPAEYNALEKLGSTCPQFLQRLCGGSRSYSPNALAAGFDPEAVVRDLDPKRHSNTPARSVGGVSLASNSAELLRAARMAHFDAGSGFPSPLEPPVTPPPIRAPQFSTGQSVSGPSVDADEEFARLLQRAEQDAANEQVRMDQLSRDFVLALQAEEDANQHGAQAAPRQRRSATAGISTGRSGRGISAGGSPGELDPMAVISELLNGASQASSHAQRMIQPGALDVRQMLTYLEGQVDEIGHALAELGESRPHHEQRGANLTTVDANTAVVTFDGSETADVHCIVCMQTFCSGETLRILPCFHRFHQGCIDPWLRENAKCPSCNHRLLQ